MAGARGGSTFAAVFAGTRAVGGKGVAVGVGVPVTAAGGGRSGAASGGACCARICAAVSGAAGALGAVALPGTADADTAGKGPVLCAAFSTVGRIGGSVEPFFGGGATAAPCAFPTGRAALESFVVWRLPSAPARRTGRPGACRCGTAAGAGGARRLTSRATKLSVRRFMPFLFVAGLARPRPGSFPLPRAWPRW